MKMPQIYYSPKAFHRFLEKVHQGATAPAAITNRFIMHAINIPWDCHVVGIGYWIGAAAQGYGRMAIYKDNGNTPEGGKLMLSIPQFAVAGANERQEISTNIFLPRGLYWVGIVWNNSTTTYYSFPAAYIGTASDSTLPFYRFVLTNFTDAFEDTCPTVTVNALSTPLLYLKVYS